MELPARPQHLAEVRRKVDELGTAVPLRRDQIDDFLTAVDEAVANAIRHGSPRGEQDTVRIICRRDADGISVEVQDGGDGFHAPGEPVMPGPEATGGRGLPLMIALADRMEVMSSPRGTRVILHKKARPE